MRQIAMAWVLCVLGAVTSGCGTHVDSGGQGGTDSGNGGGSMSGDAGGSTSGDAGGNASGGGTPTHDGTLGAECAGFAGWPCNEGLICVDDPSDDCDPSNGGADCGGICEKPKTLPATWDTCGGLAGKACASDFVCVADPSAPNHCADCEGLCIPGDSPRCAGLHGTVCPEGSVCEDDPRIDCTLADPDCSGICVSPNP